MTEMIVMAWTHACRSRGARTHSSTGVTEGAILLKTLLELLETSDGSIRLVLVLRLELGHPNHIADGADEAGEWDQPPDQGRERRGILRSHWSDLRHQGIADEGIA